jgi:hypothetical protein
MEEVHMKKVTAALTALGLALAIGSTVQAGNRMGGIHGDCSNCDKAGAPAPTEQIRKFQADTIDLRQAMMMKRFEIQRENLNATPDAAKISALQAEIKVIQDKINAARVASGLPERGSRDGKGGPMGGRGDCGKGQPGDCIGAPCGK